MCLNEDQTKRSGENKPRHLFHKRRPSLVRMSCSHEHTDISGAEELIPKTIGNKKIDCTWGCVWRINTTWKNLQIEKHKISPASGTNAFLIKFCAFRSADFLRWCLSSKRTLRHNLFLLFPIVFGINLIHFQIWTGVLRQYSPVPIIRVPNTPVSGFLSLYVSRQIVLGFLSRYEKLKNSNQVIKPPGLGDQPGLFKTVPYTTAWKT